MSTASIPPFTSSRLRFALRASRSTHNAMTPPYLGEAYHCFLGMQSLMRRWPYVSNERCHAGCLKYAHGKSQAAELDVPQDPRDEDPRDHPEDPARPCFQLWSDCERCRIPWRSP